MLELNALNRLKQVLEKVIDGILKKNIEVIIYLLTEQQTPSYTYDSPVVFPPYPVLFYVVRQRLLVDTSLSHMIGKINQQS